MELARAALTALSEEKTVSGYFKALRHLENLTAAIYQGYDFGRKALKKDFFKSGDGRAGERLNLVYNKSRHPDPNTVPTGDLHLVWIANGGLHTQGAHVTFDEFGEFLRDMGGIATRLTTDRPQRADKV
jgi:hypothetical protein